MRSVIKKLIITVTLISFVNLIGCYYQEQMNPSDYSFNDKADMEIITKDTTYNLCGEDYYYKNDTLYVSLTNNTGEQIPLRTLKSIPIDQIEIISVEKEDAAGTTFAVIGGFIGIALLAVIIGYIAGGGFYMQ